MSTKLPEEIRAMYTDAYKLHETLYDMGNSVDDWKRCVRLMRDVTVRHKEHPLMVALAVAISEQLERDRRVVADGA